MSIEWETVDVKQTRYRNKPQATISDKYISLNIDACNLIPDMANYKYIQILKNSNDNKITHIGLKFVKESSINTFSFVIRKSNKTNGIAGISINSSLLIKNLFNNEITKTVRCLISLDTKENNIVIIDLSSKL